MVTLQRVRVGDERRIKRTVTAGYWPEYGKGVFIHVPGGGAELIEVQVFGTNAYGKYDWHAKGYEEPDPVRPNQQGPYR